MSENYAGNIIVSLASLPDFLRRPILTKRLNEFFAMSGAEQSEIITNALSGGPDIPFPNLARLFKTWLEVLSEMDEQKRRAMFSAYLRAITASPAALARFHLDGLWEVYLSLDGPVQNAIGEAVAKAVSDMDADAQKTLRMISPGEAMRRFGP